jgi:hypothetical protein
MKSPHTQRPDADARLQTEEFIEANARRAPGERAKELATGSAADA